MLKISVLKMLLLLCAAPLLEAGSEGVLGQGLVNPGFHEKPAWFKASFLDLEEDLQEARNKGKRLILYFHQDGCPYCAKLINENFAVKKIVQKTHQHFQLIAINIWGDKEVTGLSGEVTNEKSFAASMKVMYTPTMVFLNEQGKQVLRINGYYAPHRFMAALDYVADREERNQSFKDYLARIQPVASTGKLHRQPDYLQPPMDLKRSKGKTDRPLLVLMEMKQCPPCDELHQQILSQQTVQKSLQNFDVALVDIWSGEALITPTGERMKATQWAERLGIQYAPSMLFFDTSGREVFRSEAYLRTFHTHAVIDYVGTGSYRNQPNFQRFIQTRADERRERGVVVELME